MRGFYQPTRSTEISFQAEIHCATATATRHNTRHVSRFQLFNIIFLSMQHQISKPGNINHAKILNALEANITNKLHIHDRKFTMK
jgi:hypothetical protein